MDQISGTADTSRCSCTGQLLQKIFLKSSARGVPPSDRTWLDNAGFMSSGCLDDQCIEDRQSILVRSHTCHVFR